MLMMSGSGKVTSETAATKIVELSKKVRELNAELQSEKTKCKQHAKKAMELESEVWIDKKVQPHISLHLQNKRWN